MIRIENWPGEDAFAVYTENPDCHRQDNAIRLHYAENTRLDVMIKDKVFSFDTKGSWPGASEGDIFFISGNGSVSCLYKVGQGEIDLFVTNKCNSNCRMCPLAENVRKRNNAGHYQWLRDYIEILPIGVPYINVTGGEPTLNPGDFLEIMRLLKVKFRNSEFQLLTNGRSLSDSVFLENILENGPGNMRFAIPLHSAEETVHDMITQSPGSFRQTDRGIKNLLQHGQKVEIRIVLSKLNIDSVEKTVKYIADNYSGVLVVNFVGMEMLGNAIRDRQQLWEEYFVLFGKIKRSILYLVSRGIDTQIYNFPLCAVDKGYWPLAVKSITKHKIRYKAECEECAARSMCGGFFVSTLKVMDPKIKVIHDL